MTEWLVSLWSYKLQVAPLLLAMLLIEIPTAIRRRHKLYYVPIYFSVFPLRELNADLATYLGEDYFLGGDSDEGVAERLRKKIVVDSVMSVALSALIVPLFAGFVSAFFLPAELLSSFIVIFLLYKLVGIVQAMVAFPRHAIGTPRNLVMLGLTYIGYLGVASEMILKSYRFASPFVALQDWGGLFASTADLIFSRVIAEFLLLAVLTSIFATMLLDRKVRDENLRHLRAHEPPEI